jgi:hypothetical protein
MLSNDFHRNLIDKSHREATISEDRRYGVHFDYKDICQRLIAIQQGRDKVAQPTISKNYIPATLKKPAFIRDIRKPAQVSKFSLNRTRSSIKVQRDLSPMVNPKLMKSRASISTKNVSINTSKTAKIKPQLLKETSLSPFRLLNRSSESYILKKSPISTKMSGSRSFMEKSRSSISFQKIAPMKKRAV